MALPIFFAILPAVSLTVVAVTDHVEDNERKKHEAQTSQTAAAKTADSPATEYLVQKDS